MRDQLGRVLDPEPPREPLGILDQMLEQERVRLADRVVAQTAELERQLRIDVRAVLGVAALVEQRRVVVPSADRRHDQIHLAGHAHRRAERARRLVRTGPDVERHAVLPRHVDPEAAHRLGEALGQPSRRGNSRSCSARPEEPGQVGAAQLVEADPERPAQLGLEHARIDPRAVVPRTRRSARPGHGRSMPLQCSHMSA